MRLVRLAMLCAAAVAATACTTDGGAGFFIVQNNVPGDGCTISSDVGSAFRSKGIVEVDYASGYLFTPVVQSLFQASGDPNVDHVIFVQGADVSLSFPRGELDDRPAFRQMFSGSIFPDGGTTSFGFDIIPRPDMDAIGEAIPEDGGSVLVRADIKMFGTADGEDLTAEPYFYNVEVCRGCLAEFLGPCAELPDGISIDEGGECDVFQDAPVDCCIDELGRPECPAELDTGT